MTLPMSRGGRGTGRRDGLVDQGADLGLGRAPAGRYSARIAISASSLVGEVLATGAPERLDRLAAGLDLAGQDGQELVVGERLAGCASRRCRRRSSPCAATSRRSASPPRMAAAMSVWMRSRRDTGLAPRAEGQPSSGWPAGARGGAGLVVGLHARSADLRSGVLLALRFLALALHGGLLVVLASASLGEDAALLDLLVEATQGAFERLVLTHSDFCQSGSPPQAWVSCSSRQARGHRP